MHISDKLLIQGNKILIIGNRSYKNLGDELILIGTIKILQKQNKKIYIQAYDPAWLRNFLKQFVDVSEIVFLTEIPKGIRSRIRFFRDGVYKNKWKELFSYIKIDTCIVGGGEILTEENPSSYRYRLASLLPTLIRKLFVKTNIYLMGGIQIPKKNLNIKLFNFLLKNTSKIFARDFETVNELKEYGFENVEFFMDTAYFAYDWTRFLTPNPSPSERGTSKYIIVNVNKNGESFLDEIVNDVKQYTDQGYKVFYVPVSKGKNEEYSDIKYAKNIPNMQILDWENDFKKFINIVAGAEIVISTRLHLFLIASFIGLKTKVYPYQRKILKMKKVLEKLL